jgi:hypothetical protein
MAMEVLLFQQILDGNEADEEAVIFDKDDSGAETRDKLRWPG